MTVVSDFVKGLVFWQGLTKYNKPMLYMEAMRSKEGVMGSLFFPGIN
jgi:hypothetical protein